MIFIRLLPILLICCLGCKNKADTKISILIPGVGIDNIKLGETTLTELAKQYGKNYKLDTVISVPLGSSEISQNVIHSIRASYDSLGISFIFRPNTETLYAISVMPPFKAKTKEGVILNESTFKDVVNIYGEKKWFLAENHMVKEYKGIIFDSESKSNHPIIENDTAKYIDNKITKITIEPNGIQSTLGDE